MSQHVGDPYYTPAPVRKDETGKVWVKPRGFGFKKMSKGNNDQVLFSKPAYLREGKHSVLI